VSRACEDRLRQLYVPATPDLTAQGSPTGVARAIRNRPVPLLAACDVCGSADLAEIRCKVICRNCRTILQSCADL
jgi:hypothetical protein